MNESETAVWMRRLASLSRTENALPDPVLIWWQARLLEREEARARATRPLTIVQWASALVAAILIVLCVFHWPGIRDMLAPFAAFTPWVAAASGVILMGLAVRLGFSE